MTILRTAKVATLRVAQHLGVFSRVGASKWRRQRLLILCYHGVSLHDEHEWSDVHISAERLERRFQVLTEKPFNVLPLAEALERLSNNDLPPGSVALTFDEGFVDFKENALPLLRKYKLPATLYVPTYYSKFRRPIFDLAASYFLWRGRGRTIRTGRLLPGSRALRIPVGRKARHALHLSIRSHTSAERYSAAEKDAMLAELAAQIGVDWNCFVDSRMLQLMSPEELAALDPTIVDVQLHTHRHRTPREKRLFIRELDDNVAALGAMGFAPEGRLHFCYPSGDADPVFYPWLRARRIQSATTCVPQMASRKTHRLSLPRVVDTMGMTETEFRGWLSGFSSFVPRRAWRPDFNGDASPVETTAPR